MAKPMKTHFHSDFEMCVANTINAVFAGGEVILSTVLIFFFFKDTAPTEIYTNLNTLSLHDALPISSRRRHTRFLNVTGVQTYAVFCLRSEEHTSELQSHSELSYAVVCLKTPKRAPRACTAPYRCPRGCARTGRASA